MKTRRIHCFTLGLLAGATPLASHALPPAQLLAHYTFEGTAADATGNSPPIELGNTIFTNGTLCLNGIYEGGNAEGFHAFARTTGFSYQSFTVALDFFAADFANDNILTGGFSYRWFSLRHNAGRLEVTLNNQALAYLLPDSRLKTNEWQTVICSVDASAKRIITVLNGQRLGDIVLSPDFHFEVIGSPAENSDRLFTFANYSNGSVFHGYVDNLKVWNRALTSSEIDALLPLQLLAHYTLDETAADATGNSPPIELGNTIFTNGTLCLNGIYEGGNAEGFHAFARITGFSYQSFTVALDFFAADFANDNILTGGFSYRWFSLRHNAGRLEVTLNNQALAYLLPDSRLKTNEWQTVICSVDASAKRIITVLNGQRLGDIVLSPDFHFEVIGSPAENSDRLFTFANYSNGSVFHGYVDNLKVWNRALTSSEIGALLSNPALTVRPAGANQVVLSWPHLSNGYVLQQTANMNGQGGAWMNVPNSPLVVGSNKEVTLTVTGRFCLFRLSRP